MKDIVTIALVVCGIIATSTSFFVGSGEALQWIQMGALFFVWFEVRVK